MTRIRLLGDHSKYHCGSAAAFRAIRAQVERYGKVVGKHDDFELLVVNGEGSMHHDSSGCRKKMAAIEEALRSGKRAMLINSVWQANDQAYADILKRCERVVVREVISQRAMADQGVQAEVAIDQSFHDEVDPTASYTDFERRAVFTDFFSTEFDSFVRLNSKWAQKFDYIDMTTMSWSSLVRSLRTASVLVTGRHHAVYAACRARLPFLAMRGNTHKNEGLIETARSTVPLFDVFADIRRALEEQAYSSYDYNGLFDWMHGQRPWKVTV